MICQPTQDASHPLRLPLGLDVWPAQKRAYITALPLKHRLDHIARLIAMDVYALGHSARDEGHLLPRPSPGRAESSTHFVFTFIPTHVNDEALGHHISSIDRSQAQYNM